MRLRATASSLFRDACMRNRWVVSMSIWTELAMGSDTNYGMLLLGYQLLVWQVKAIC